MQAKPVFMLTTVIGLFFGISMLLLPEFILDFIEVSYLDGGPAMARHTASWVLAGSLFAFLIRNEEHSSTRQAIFVFFDIAFSLMVIVELYGYFMALGGVMLWSIIAIHALLAVLYTYLFLENR